MNDDCQNDTDPDYLQPITLTKYQGQFMLRFLVFLSCVTLYSHIASAQQLFLRVATYGYENQPNIPENAERQKLRSIETLISPGEAFSTKTIYDSQLIQLRGTCKRAEDSKIEISLQYRYSKIPDELKKQILQDEEPLPEFLPGSSLTAAIKIKVGEEQILGGGGKTAQSDDGTTLHSLNEMVAALIQRKVPEKKAEGRVLPVLPPSLQSDQQPKLNK